MDAFNINVSRFASVRATAGTEVSLIDELEKIRSGFYKKEILECRRILGLGNKTLYTEMKCKLPAITMSGYFVGSHSAVNLSHYTAFIVIDIDHLETQTIEDQKKRLFDDRLVAAVWISPSGCGLKLLVKTKAQVTEHKDYFYFLFDHFKNIHGIEIDRCGSDVNRLCLVSYDPNLLLKADIEECIISREILTANRMTQRREESSQSRTIVSGRQLLHGSEGRNSAKDRDLIIKIINFLSRQKKSITSTYDHWLRVGFAIANSFTYDLGKKYYMQLCRLDGENHDEYRSEKMIESCYFSRRPDAVNFATIIFLAESVGFVVKRST